MFTAFSSYCFQFSLQAMNHVRLKCVRIMNIVEFLINSRTNEAQLLWQACTNVWTTVFGNTLMLVIGKNSHDSSFKIELILPGKCVNLSQNKNMSVLKKKSEPVGFYSE